MKEILMWVVTSEVKNGKREKILLVMPKNENIYGFEKYNIKKVMEKDGFKTIEELMDYLDNHILD